MHSKHIIHLYTHVLTWSNGPQLECDLRLWLPLRSGADIHFVKICFEFALSKVESLLVRKYRWLYMMLLLEFCKLGNERMQHVFKIISLWNIWVTLKISRKIYLTPSKSPQTDLYSSGTQTCLPHIVLLGILPPPLDASLFVGRLCMCTMALLFRTIPALAQ